MIPDSVILTTTIASGETDSAVIALPAGFYLAGLVLPAITTSTAITFSVSTDGVTYVPLYNDGSVYSITIDNTLANAIVLSEAVLSPWEYVKISVADAQTGIKSIGAVVRIK